mmetsp:Transcript_29808/g.67291  ORF Transcript_29808/g.67291 Transcript_29808/m.67291 type:complete len:362 (+) Transcript_29808:97-1182(+)
MNKLKLLILIALSKAAPVIPGAPLCAALGAGVEASLHAITVSLAGLIVGVALGWRSCWGGSGTVSTGRVALPVVPSALLVATFLAGIEATLLAVAVLLARLSKSVALGRQQGNLSSVQGEARLLGFVHICRVRRRRELSRLSRLEKLAFLSSFVAAVASFVVSGSSRLATLGARIETSLHAIGVTLARLVVGVALRRLRSRCRSGRKWLKPVASHVPPTVLIRLRSALPLRPVEAGALVIVAVVIEAVQQESTGHVALPSALFGALVGAADVAEGRAGAIVAGCVRLQSTKAARVLRIAGARSSRRDVGRDDESSVRLHGCVVVVDRLMLFGRLETRFYELEDEVGVATTSHLLEPVALVA